MNTTTYEERLATMPMQVSNKTLLAILSVVPIAALIPMIDLLFTNGAARDFMVTDPRKIAYWTAVLTVPHIIASLMTFADKEYLGHYKRQLFKGSVVALTLGFGVPIITGFGIASYFGFQTESLQNIAINGAAGTLIVMAFYTMYHNLMQQYGISLMMLRQGPTFDFQMWRWFTIIPAGLAYVVLMTSDVPIVAVNMDLCILTVGLGLTIATIFGIRFVRTILKNPNYTKIGLVYFLSNMSMLYVCFGLIITGYGFLATLVPRIIHDLTAFWIYMVHDKNRNEERLHNPVYYIPKKIGLSPLLICPIIALIISYIFMEVLGNLYWVALFVTALNFMHYYMEGHMWKRGTPHRQHVPFV